MIDELEISPAIETLAEVLRHRAGEEPDRLAYTFLVDGEAEGGRLTFGELDTRSRRLAAVLLESATPGSRVLLLLPPGLEFAVAFLACLNAGLVAVPAYPPRSPRALPRLRSIIEDSEPAIALTTAELGERTRRWWRRDGQPPALAWLNVEEAQGGALTADLLPRVAGDTPAFLQYTSGSTSTPKGVVVSHRNLVHNQELIRNACEHSARSVFVSWLPLYHDLGLIGNLLQALYVGASCVLMSPMAFLQRPMRWLEAISRYGATTSGGPNFAYELCRRKSSPAERQKLDLSRWRIAFNGAEPVRSDTLKRFAEAFAEAGFQRRAFYPCYGLAESTLMVSGGRPDGSPVIGYFDGEALEHDRAVPTLPEVAGSRALVGCGRVLGGQRLAILSGADGRRLKPGAIGEIVVAGGSVASGYWNRPEDTAQTFVSFPNAPDLGRVLRTGDLGFVHDGELFITGRLKDLIIVRGRNLYPQDVERTAESSHPELLADGGAAFSVEVEGEERLVVVHEMARRRQQQPQRVAESVRRAVAEEHEVQPWEVVLIRTGTLPKTTSGKVQRGVCRQQYLEGSLRLLGRSRPLAAAPEPAAPEVDLEALDRLSPSERRQVVTSRLGLLTARVLRLEEAPAPDVALTALGLDSLAAVKLQQAAESDLGAELPLSRLLAGASLEQLAPATSEQVSRRRDVAEPVVAASADSTFQLSHGQQALWFLHRLAPESPAYIIAGAARAPSGLDATRLRKAAEALTARHPALRTTFTQPAGGDPVQRVHTELPPAFEQHDATSWSATFLSRQLLEEAERPFDLEQGPLIRFGVFREASGADLLLLAVHHLVADFWSLAVLMRELGALYSGDRPESLPKLARDYRDYVVRQRAMVEGPQGQRLLEGWRRQLADLPAELTLPSDRPRPAVQSYRGNTLTTRLGADLTQRLLALSNAQGATLFVTLLAGFQALLARYCNGQLPPVGTPTAGRNDRDFAELVGYFVNPVVLRADPSGDPTASEWLSRVRRVALEAFDHQSYPFALLAEQLRPVRDPSRSPLFQVMFALHVAPRSAEQALAALALGLPGTRLELGELKLESTSALRWRGAQFDLTLTAGRVTVGQDDSIAATLEYNTDLFDRPTIARIAAHFETLLEALAAAPEHKLSALPLLTSAERHQLILGWNDGCDPEGAAVPVHQRFAEQARCRPQATALADGGHAWTYEQLDEASNRLARHLQGLGVGPEARVAIGLERSPQQVLAILGVLKAGGAYVPLDPAYPAARLSFLVESSAPVLLITRRALRDRLPALPGRPPVLLDDLAALDSHSSDPNAAPRAALETEHPAYVLYTSGSTGRPKGVSVPHHALACHAAATAECYGLGPTDRVLQFAAVGFDVAAEELFPTWIAGGSVWPAPDPLPAPADFSSFVERHRLTVLNLPASYWREWLTEMIRAEQEPPACLRLMVVGSEAVAASDLQQWQRLAGARIAWHNAYGVTETTITSTIYTPSNDAPAGATPVPIGRPLLGTHAYVVDRNGRSLPATMHGELWLGGSGVARGYPGLPARTAERFTPDPFAGIRGARLYRTGDLARWRGDGQLEFFGRLDQQVALRGFRIEPGEVEAMILRHGGLREAVVTIAEHRTGQARLVAWLVPREEGKLEIDPLRTFLRQQLPSYLVPTVYVPLTDLPRLANGKIDRGALGRRPLPASEGGRTAWAAPATPVEELVAAIFAEVLGADDSVSERIGLHDDFFELGGHSLLAIRLSSRLREAFGVELPVQAIFEAPTVADLAARLDAASRDNELPPAPPIRAAVHSTPPTSFAQQRLWFLESWQPGQGVYNMAGALDLEGVLDVQVLAGALAAIVARHETLRTRFAMVDGEPVQRVTAAPAPGLALCDLSGLRERHRRTEIERLCAHEARRSFDLADEPLMRSLLLREEERQHRLFVNLHHIVADGISLDILTGELGLLYDAGLTGRRATVPALPVQYADYAAWQRQWLTAAVLEPRLNAWRQRLREVPVTLELPIDRPRPAVQSLQGGRQAWRLRRSATAALQALARRQGATLFIAVLAAFEAWLHRLSGQRAFTVGTPVANRVRPELEGLIGLFVNTVVVPADLGDAPTFRRLLGRCQRQALAAWADQELPFEKLVEAVDTERDPSRNPMFQAMLVLEPEGEAAPQLPGLDVRAVEIHNGGAKFDLLLSAAASQQRLEGSLEYSAALFDPVTVQRLAGYLETLIESALADPDRPLAQLSMLRRPQRFQLLFEWNDYRAALPETTLHGLFEAQVARSGSANALVAGTERWSYRRLDRESSRIARHLRQLGVGPEAIVGLFLERRPELVAALLGVLKAGGAYLPLDPEYPAQRVALTLADAGAAVVLTTTHLADRLPVEQPAVRLDREELAEGHPAGDVSGAALDGANLAYVIYTSGSTGRPKGVAMTHRNAAAMVGWATGVYSAAEMSSVLGATSICFDLSVFELFAPLSRGGTVVLAANALELTELPTADEVTLVNTVPSALTELLRAGPLPPSVRTVNLAGEPLTRKLTDAIYAGSRAQRVYNLYGPSEDTTYSTFTGVAQGEAGEPTIGRPIGNTRALVLDRQLLPLPAGVAGELCLGGEGLARGYLGRPATTAERFVPDALSGGSGLRLYRTGDRVRWRNDGELVFLGRFDYLVKVRGFRIELGEVEAALATHPSLHEVVVVVGDDGSGQNILVAYVVGRTSPAPSVAELRAFLDRRLPAFMVPSRFVVLEELPRTPNGKVDRAELPAPTGRSGTAHTAPRSSVETLLTQMWSELLGVERIGIHDDFFAHGGHSLLAMRLITRLRQVFAVELPVRVLFEAPTVARLAAAVAQARRPQGAITAPPIRRRSDDEAPPLTSAQLRFWFLDRWRTGHPAYNVPTALRLTGRLDVSALATALDQIACRHQSLRTTFALVDGEPVQRIAAVGSLPLPMVDLRSLTSSTRASEAHRLANEHGRYPFDLTRGPLASACLVRLADNEHALLFNSHHIIFDGWSIGVLLSELSALYAAFCHHRPSPLPALPVRYSDFARWSRRWFTGAALDDQLSFWRQRLAGIPTRLELPTDRPRPNERRLRGGQIAMTLAPRATRRLEALARRHEATVFMILTAALQVLLRRLSGQRTVVVGTPVANRPRPEVEGLIGLFVNTVALRGEVSLESTFVRHLARCRQDALDAYAHQDLPFETLVETLQPDRDPSLTPVFQVALALQNAPLDLRLPELETAPWEVHNGTAQLDLSLSLRPQDGSLEGWIEYDADLFDHTTVQRWAKAYRSLLDAVTADSGGLLGDLSWIDPGERAQLLGEWNDSFAAQPEQRPVDRQIAARAARDPAAIAVSSKAGTLTYGELEGRSNHLAHRLQACGLTAEAVVAVLVEPSLEMVVSLLAILKAGGAYLPLDPVSPAERLAFLIEDSAAPLVVGGKSQLAAIAGRVRTPLLEIDRYGEADAPARASTPPRPTTLDHAAYVIYTSGSTGRPKGVVIHHRGLNNLVAWHRRTYRVAPGDRASQVASPAFDASVWEIWPYLAAGARLEIAPSELRPQPEQLVRWLAARAIDLCFLPTPVAEEALARPLPNDLRLRALLTGGDRLHGGLSAALPFALVNHYGPTESTVLATAGRATGQPEVGTRQPAIGRPVANTRCHVVDRRLQPMPIGVAGELILGGIGLARGYLARPGLTAAQFVPDALDTTPGERLYRTGDRVRCLADGRLDFLGRLDHQVKIRGQRIELGEIEATLVRHPDLQDAVVTSRELPHRRGRQLVAYVVGARAGVPDAETLREFLSRTLPASMVPTAFVALAALPLTNRGKVDRAALRPPADSATGDRDFVPPRSPVEAMVAEVWAELLDRRQVGAHDDFFAIGGHSLAAARALARIRDLTGAEISLHDFFAAPSLADVATAVAQATGQSAGEIPALEPRQHDDNSLLSFAQERLWLLHRLDPASPAYNVPAAIRLSGALDETALERALGEVVTRHQALRTVFPSHNGRPVQKLRSAIGPALATVDLRGLAEEQRRPLATTLAAAESLRPFDLARDPLARFHLLRLGELENLLFVNLHHIVADGWSIGVLVRELGSLYQAFCRGARSPLPPLPVQYIDYACWQRQWLSDDRLAAEIEHWRPRLANAPAALQLPIDRPRPAVQGFRGGRCPMRFGRELTGRLRTLGAASSSTLFMILLATLHGLLARLCGQQDMVIGAPVANRTEVETEGLIGFFVNTLALRLEAPGDPSFAELLARARTVALDAYAHQHLPFERLVEALAPERDLSRAPLFQVMLVLQNTPAEALELPGLKLELEEIDAATAKLDLTLSMTETGDRLEGFWEYDRDLFDRTTVQRLALQFEQLVQAAAAATVQPLSELPLLAAGERQQLIEWNDTGASTPGRTESKTLSQLFAEQAVRTPHAIALVAGSECLSYRHLACRSAQLARHLHGLGVGPETNVGIFLRRSPQLVTALLAVLEAGGAYIPLDPEYPQERVAFTLDDAQASLVLTQQALAGRLPQAVSQRVLDAEPLAAEPPDAESLPEELDEPGDSSIGPGRLAYVIYTSGSTGRPKGVAIEHRHAVAMVRWATHTYAPRELTGVLASTSVCFDLSVFEIFVPLACGGTVILAPDALSLADQTARVSLVNTVPSAMAELVRADHLPTSVRTINLAGEPLKRSLVEPLYGAAGSGTRLYNLYGPSEDTTYSTCTAVAAGNAAEPTIGRPIARTQAHVVDGRQRQVPIAVAGELVLGGAGVARGYLRRPGLTAERFVPDGLGRGLGQRLYRTGDLARFTPAGELEFLGRTDHQVKIRGFRIELGEIESALCEHPAVTEAVVVTRHDLTGATAEEPTSEALLVAYVVAMSESPGSGELRRHLERRLPAYMTPSKFVELAAMPLTPNGKIDRRALPAPDRSRRDVESRWIAPRTPVEELLATIWCDLLAVERVGVDDNFFELGGHSLLASQMAVRVERAIGWEPSLKQIFEQPTIATLAASAESVTPSEPLRPLNRTGAMPLSFAQQRLWFLDRLEPGSAAYNVPVAVRLQGRVVAAALAAACSEMVRRHQVLRTVFELVAGEPMQRVVPSRPLPLPVIDLQALPAAAREAEAHALIESEACRPFDLELAPLLRIQLLSLGPEANVLLANMHHIAADGWSIGLMLNELARLYDAAVRNRSSSLPTLPIQYADFAVWQREQLAGERLDAELGYWRQKLAGAPEVLELPTDRPRSTQLTSRSGRHRAMLPASLVRRLKALAQSTSTTPYMTLLAVLGALLSRSTGQRDLIVGSPIANRGPIETEKLIGFFVNTLALRLDLTSDPSFIELLERVRSAALGAYAHQQLPFEKLVEQLSDGRDLSHAPLVQVVLALQNAPIRMPQLPGIEVEIEELTPATAKFDLTVSLVETNGRLEGFWEYDRDLFDATTIRRLAEQFENLAASAVASPQQRLNAMSWLTANERQALREWNDTASRYPREAPIHRLFETWAASTPEAIAVVCGDQQLSYRELDRQANRLGHHFRACGVGPEVCVGLCVERSIEMVVSILGILKAGGIYVPLDPDYPPERLAFMLEDVQASVVVIAGKLAGRLTLPQTTPSLRVVDLEAGTLGRYGTDRPDVEVAPENLAYVMFTSGSTGRPKGVAVAHHNVARLVRSTRYANLDSEQVFLQFAPVSFDAATLEIWGPLANGGRLVVFPPHTPSLSELGGFLESRRVSTLWLTAGLFHRMAGENLATLGALDQLLAGGDVLSSRHVRRVLDDNPHCTVINGYGPTENTTFTTCATMRDASDVADPVSIGRPIANTTVHVLDEALRVQAIGVFGHLYIGGEGLARGYARQAARTAERFVPSPLSARPGRRLYDSGDLARWRPDGSLEFQGRSDHQVKIRGFRIELGEIESVLTQHPGVTQATVLARRDRAPGQSEAAFDEARLVAYFVPGDQEPNERALRQLLASQLPSYMVPAAFVSLAALPLTANGKIDRRALPAFDGARPDLEKPFVAPRTAVEEMLAELWSDLLEVNRIGVHDDFFELGGHSLLAIQLLGRLRDDFGVDLPVRALFEAPSIEGLSRALAEALLAQADERAAEQALAEVEQQHG